MPRSYQWLVAQQALRVPRDAAAAKGAACRVLLGVPTYGDGLLAHNPRAENINIALRGVREGLAEPDADLTTLAGVAPFAEYTTSSEDWAIYNSLWTAPAR